jgi:hypothetical protein
MTEVIGRGTVLDRYCDLGCEALDVLDAAGERQFTSAVVRAVMCGPSDGERAFIERRAREIISRYGEESEIGVSVVLLLKEVKSAVPKIYAERTSREKKRANLDKRVIAKVAFEAVIASFPHLRRGRNVAQILTTKLMIELGPSYNAATLERWVREWLRA